MELTFVEEEIPKIVRQGGTGREAEKWEVGLAPLKSPNMKGKSYRVWTFSTRNSAQSRMTTVRSRLNKVAPQDNFQLKVRPVPDSDEFGVYAQYDGTFTPAEMEANEKRHQERSERTKKSRTAIAAVPNGTAKERVAAAHKAKAS